MKSTDEGIESDPDEHLQIQIPASTKRHLGHRAVETREPIRTPEAFAARCCNELGVEGTVRFLKNIAGLWLIQECKRQWALDGDNLSYAEMAKLAEAAPSFSAFIDPDDAVFASPGRMPAKIQAWCERTGQQVPRDKGTVLRVASESLALKYRTIYENFCRLSGRRFERLHAGGGGVQNAFLAQATADALGIEVIAGPIEATSCGNIVVQMIATGHLPDLAAGRQLVRNSFTFETYRPQDRERWQAAYAIFERFIGR